MVQLQPSSTPEVIYPESDGKPMADNTKQFRWIVTIKENFLDVIEPINQWVSPRLKIRFELGESDLQVYHPDGTRFLTYTEIAQRAEQAEERAEQAEERAARLAERLRELGIDTD